MSANTTRRAILAGAASVPAFAISGSLVAAEAAHDPIIVAIEKHRQAWAEYDRMTRMIMDLEEKVPRDRRRRYHVQDRHNAEMIATDDPRWTKAQDDWFAQSEKTDDLATDLLNVAPTTISGVAALLDYVAEFEENEGELFPDVIEDGEGIDRNPLAELMRVAAGHLTEIKIA